MIAKKIMLLINELENSSLQSSLQSCQLRTSTCLLVQAVSFADCKEKTIENQSVNKISFANLFAQNSI